MSDRYDFAFSSLGEDEEEGFEIAGEGDEDELALDSELEAAIEYKIACSGYDGVSQILDLVRLAVKRNARVAGTA